jgi:phosphoribosylanthranilate isomerase
MCGMQREEDLLPLQDLDVDYAGFILVPGRKRTVKPEAMKRLKDALPAHVKSVGVMMNPEKHEAEWWQEQVSFDVLQFHGEETPGFCRWAKEELGVQVVKVMHIAPGAETPLQGDIVEAYATGVDAVLLDTVIGNTQGGTGKRFAWDRIPDLRAPWEERGIPVWAAGGVHPDNVAELLRVAPAGIDVSSGIETEGRKDPEKMRRLVERVRHYDEQAG